MAERTASNNNVVVASLIAGLAGAAIGMLLAPRSGRETREQLHDTASDLKSKAGDGLTSAKDSLDQGLNKAKQASDHFTSAIKHTGRRTKQHTEELKQEISDDMDDTNLNKEV